MEDEVLDFTRQLAIADHRRRRGPTSAPRNASFHPSTATIPEQAYDDESSDTDEGLFQPLLLLFCADLLTSSSGGITLSFRQKDAPSGLTNISPMNNTLSSSSLSSQLVRVWKTFGEVEKWASTHNALFLQSLDKSMSAHKHAAGPQTPGFNRTMIASVLQTPSPNSIMATSPGPSSLISSGLRSHRTSLTSPFSSSPLGRIPQTALSPTPHPFRPNNMVLERMGLPTTSLSQVSPGRSYLGNRHSSSGAQEAQNLLDFENCALFLTKIPADVTLQELFRVITTGAVFCLHINPPNGIHTTKAAKLAFMAPEAAKAFLVEIQSPRGVVLHGKRIQGRYNRNGYVRNENTWQSRVLELIGPTAMMTLEYWTSHFSMFSEFELEAYHLLPTNVDDVSVLQFRFARVDGQAQTCLQCIRTDPSLQGVVQVRYGQDPCGSATAF